MRLTPLLFALAFAGCTGTQNAGPPAEAGPSGDGPREPAPPRSVTLEVASLPSASTSAVVFIGFSPGDVDGNWAREGVMPADHSVSKDEKVSAAMSINAALHSGLTYFAILDVNGDGMPTEGELASGPTPVGAAGEPRFLLQAPWGTAAATEETASVPERSVETVQRTLVVNTEIKPPFLKKGRVLVVGLPASGEGTFVGPLDREPSLVWASDDLELTWPVELSATLPMDGDLMVLLDLDGGLLPSVGDLASAAQTNFSPPAEGEKLTVTLAGPLTELGEGGDSGDEAPAP